MDLLFLVQTRFSLTTTDDSQMGELLEAKLEDGCSVLKSCLEQVRATTNFNRNLVLYGAAEAEGIKQLEPRGSFRKDFAAIIDKYEPETVVRIAGNSPLIKPEIIDDLLTSHRETGADYTFSPDLPNGLGPLEIFETAAFRKVSDRGSYDEAAIHIFPALRQSPEINVNEVACPEWKNCGISLSVYNHRNLANVKRYQKIVNKEGYAALVDRQPEEDFPNFVQLEPTSRCNLSCQFCSRDSLDNYGDMKLSQFKQIIDENPGIRRMSLNGDGEPLLNKNIGKMISYAAEQGIDLRMVTNGLLLEEELIQTINEHLSILVVSLDSASPKTYEELRGVDGFKQVTGKIKKMTQRKKQTDGKLKFISLNCVCSRLNTEELPEIIRLAGELGVDNLNLKLMNTNYSKGDTEVDPEIKRRLDELVPDYEKLESAINKSLELIEQSSVKVEFDIDVDSGFSFQDCVRRKWCFINQAGWVTPCCLRCNPEVINFGNVLKEDLETIWNSDQFREFRRKLMEGPPPEVCEDCPRLETSTLVEELELGKVGTR